MGTIDQTALNLIKQASKTSSDNYPETMGRCIFVNAPVAFTFVWGIIKGWIDEKTRNNIKILGTNFKKDLLELCDADQLPSFLGGTCECNCEGGCMFSDKGPWNDYEPVQPFGFKARDSCIHFESANKDIQLTTENQQSQLTTEKGTEDNLDTNDITDDNTHDPIAMTELLGSDPLLPVSLKFKFIP